MLKYRIRTNGLSNSLWHLINLFWWNSIFLDFLALNSDFYNKPEKKC